MLILFLGIVFVVGVDVGMNTVAPKLLIERSGYAVEQAGIGSSVYFVCRTVGALLGSLLLVRMSDVRYFRIHIFAAIAAMIALWFTHATAGMLVLVGLIGFACSSIFSVIYSAALKSHPDKANEISGLMITGVCGGAVIPPLMGASADFAGSQIGSLVVIGCCMAYRPSAPSCCAVSRRENKRTQRSRAEQGAAANLAGFRRRSFVSGPGRITPRPMPGWVRGPFPAPVLRRRAERRPGSGNSGAACRRATHAARRCCGAKRFSPGW